MPGYQLIQKENLSPPRPEGHGVSANKQKKAFYDFLRELEQEDFPFNEHSDLLVEGLEDVLLSARTSRETEKEELEIAAKQVRRVLQRAAQKLDSRGVPDVQITFRLPLKRGHTLIVEHVKAELPIYLIFGSPSPDEINGQKVFRVPFNLSSV